MQDVINNRGLFLRKRLTATCIVTDATKRLVIKLTGILIEELQVFANMWRGKVFRDSQQLREYHDNVWKPRAQTMGMYSTEMIEVPLISSKQPFRVQGIQYMVDFA